MNDILDIKFYDVSKKENIYISKESNRQKESDGACLKSIGQMIQKRRKFSTSSVDHSPNMVLLWSHDQSQNKEMLKI